MSDKIAVFFGPIEGNTEKVAKLIKEKLGDNKCELFPISEVDANLIDKYDKIIFGVSTIGTHNWAHSNTSTDWDVFLPKIKEKDFSNKNIAIFGLGDQVAYSNHFVDDMRIVYDVVIKNGGKVHGRWSTKGYDFNESEAVINNEFVGLAIDEDHQGEFTVNRVSKWIDQIAPLF